MMAGALAPGARAASSTVSQPRRSASGVSAGAPCSRSRRPTARGARSTAGDVSLEWKLDGARIQAHKSGADVRVFSRNLRDVTSAVPEVVEAMRALAVHDVIVDGEVIALRPDDSPHPFQVTMQRFGRKLDVERLRAEIPLTPFLFDCLYVDGESLIDAARNRASPSRSSPDHSACRVRPAYAGDGARFPMSLRRGHGGLMASRCSRIRSGDAAAVAEGQDRAHAGSVVLAANGATGDETDGSATAPRRRIRARSFVLSARPSGTEDEL